MAQKARMTVDRDFRIGEVDKRIYGSFIEHEPSIPASMSRGTRPRMSWVSVRM